jgi:hypothetical protein
VSYKILLTHKHQTKANDCWYACTQMLLTWKNKGITAKPNISKGTHTGHLHSGLLGHTLHADHKSKHLDGVLAENDLIALRNLDLSDMKKAEKALQTHGPIIVGGDYGEILNHLIKGLGHFIVVAGVDDQNDKFWIHDPWHKQPQWVDQAWVRDNAWSGDACNFICK